MPLAKIEGAAQLVEHMKKERMGKGKLKRQRRAELTGNESADAELKVNSVNYYHLTKRLTSPDMVHGVVREGRGATGGQSEAMRRPQRAARACSAILLRACES